MSTQRSCTYSKSSVEGKMWAVNASAKEYAQVLPVNGGCFSLRALPRRLRNAGGKSESPRRAQAHTLGPLAARTSSKGRKKERQITEISVNSSILAPNTQTPHPSVSPQLWESLQELDEQNTSTESPLMWYKHHFSVLTVGLPFTSCPSVGLSALGSSCSHFCMHPGRACLLPLVFRGYASSRDEFQSSLFGFYLADIPWMCSEQKCCRTSGKCFQTRRKTHT